MKADQEINAGRRRSRGVFARALVPGLVAGLLLMFPRTAPGHLQNTHQLIVDYAAQNATLLPTPVTFTSPQRALLQQGTYDEDNNIRPRDHAFNPITDSGFLSESWSGTTARNAILDRWNSMTTAFVNGDFDSGDGSGAWHFLGRASHLMEDMTSPLHSMAVWHDGVINPTCQFEGYWGTNDASLISAFTNPGGPLHSGTLDAKATEKLDAFSIGRLQDRFNNSSPHNQSDDPRGWVETMVWATYFRATLWAQVIMSSSTGNGSATSTNTTSTTFSDGTVGAQTNVLHRMFGSGNVRWINNFIGDDYYEITDRNGNVFRWMSFTDIDDWSSAGRFWANGQKDTSVRIGGSDDDDDGVRVTGRFWFDLRELGKSGSGTFNRYCYPASYPDGSAMTEHLHQYLGNYLDPLTVRYNAGLLGLANRRVTVRTADATPAGNFSFGRKDNFGHGPAFDAGPGGSNFFFVAKSQVTLTAPSADSAGRSFARWLKDGSAFSGNTSATITINTTNATIPTNGVIYTAEYAAPIYLLDPLAGESNFQFSFFSGIALTHAIQFRTNLTSGPWQTVTNISGDGTLKQVVAPIGSSREGYFRIESHY